MAQHISWTNIESFYNVRKAVGRYPSMLRGRSTVTYRAKVKLHGTNAGIMINETGVVTALSRSKVLSINDDNAGFAKWVASKANHFSKFAPLKGTLTIFGEWVGPGIQKGVAVNLLNEKVFVIFAARVTDRDDCGDIDFIAEPHALVPITAGMPDCHVLPWFNDGEEFMIDLNETPEVLQPTIDSINAYVVDVETRDPWVFQVFGVEGVGEGLVFYPVSREHLGYENFSNLCFKAKGEKHQVVSKTKPVQFDPTVAASLTAFVDLVVTPSRLEQGCRVVNDGELTFDQKNIGPFLSWINKDLIKETSTELSAAGLEQKQAYKACGDKARSWYISQMKKV